MCPSSNSQQSPSLQPGELLSEEVRTIFVLGFLSNVKESDFYELLKWYPGFEACMMDFKGDQPFGFARFKTQRHALAARDALQNMQVGQFSGHGSSILRAELARKNLYEKPHHAMSGRSNHHWGPQEGFGGRATGLPAHGASGVAVGATGPMHMGWNLGLVSPTLVPPATVQSSAPQLMSPSTIPAAFPGYSLAGPMSAPQMSTMAGMSVLGGPGAATCFVPYFTSTFTQIVPGTHGALMTPMFPSGTAYGYPLTTGPSNFQNASGWMSEIAKLPLSPTSQSPTAIPSFQKTKDHPPCNTLFIGNLGMGTHEWEIRAFFGSLAGFRQLKVLRSEHGTTCFVEFQDIASAAAIHNTMQGAVLKTSDRGGMRIQFSKNPFGSRGDLSTRVSMHGAAPPVEAKRYGLNSSSSTSGNEAVSRRGAAWRSTAPREQPRMGVRGRQEEAALVDKVTPSFSEQRVSLPEEGSCSTVDALSEALHNLVTNAKESNTEKVPDSASPSGLLTHEKEAMDKKRAV